MASAPTLDHQEVVGEIYYQLRQALGDQSCRAYVVPVDVRVPRADESDDAIDTVVQPDVLVICDRAKTDRRGVRGGPDFVVEVLSPGTASHDHVQGAKQCQCLGIMAGRQFAQVPDDAPARIEIRGPDQQQSPLGIFDRDGIEQLLIHIFCDQP
ncbi:Uma2 family endonuclease [uncultured Thiodictyon sp.]|uniref:Uma2 family endonuclease n=1 Tax=uncultured Thiodictyon sp. TaxID=1846217 RepID=UPI0025EFF8F1|nr:Uma2 family endonuclease [uncultured Thiodictyon sp.]